LLQSNPQLKLQFKERICALSMPFNEKFVELKEDNELYR
jgi:hypothetical protein